jgi:gliding motility-associated-like protein
VAHFVPPTRYDIVLDVVPRDAATIIFDGQTYTEFPVLVSAPEGTPIPFSVVPAEYHDFLYWTVKNASFTPQDSTSTELSAGFLTTDTIVAFLRPQDHTFFLPNAFSPNGDGINDVFQPMGNVIVAETYRLEIFDRWGQEVFLTDDQGKGWDGAYGGVPAQAGVYVFHAQVQDAISKERHEFMGHVTLLR